MADAADQTVEAFRQDVRAWAEVNFPSDLKGLGHPTRLEERPQPTEEQVAWRKAVGGKGWGRRRGLPNTAVRGFLRPTPELSTRNFRALAPTTRSGEWAS